MADHERPSHHLGSLAHRRPFLGRMPFCFGTLSSVMACVAKDLEWNSQILVSGERGPGRPCIIWLPLDVISLLTSDVWETRLWLNRMAIAIDDRDPTIELSSAVILHRMPGDLG